MPPEQQTCHLLLIPQQEQATCQTGGKQAGLFSVHGARDFKRKKKRKKERTALHTDVNTIQHSAVFDFGKGKLLQRAVLIWQQESRCPKGRLLLGKKERESCCAQDFTLAFFFHQIQRHLSGPPITNERNGNNNRQSIRSSDVRDKQQLEDACFVNRQSSAKGSGLPVFFFSFSFPLDLSPI